MLTKKRAFLIILIICILVLAPVLVFCQSSQGQSRDVMKFLNIWQIDSFEGGKGSRAQYLQQKADECFDGTHVYVKVTSLSADAARANIKEGNIPDLISYGAGFYGIESLINVTDFTYVCWCRGAYVLLSLDESADFSDVNAQNTVINIGKDNLSRACALLEGLSGAKAEASTSAYVSLIGGKYKYLLGTQRDIYRLETREQAYTSKVITSFNDLYQNISVLCEGENYAYSKKFIDYLIENSSDIATLGLVSEKTNYTGAMAEIQRAEFDYTIKSFTGYDYYRAVNDAIDGGDVNSLKNLLK